MRRTPLHVFTAIVIVLSSSFASIPAPVVPATGDPLPPVMLWAWERPTDLRDLDRGVGVAFLAQTITIAGSTRPGAALARTASAPEPAGHYAVTPRRNPLRVSLHTPLMAVTRIESAQGEAARWTDGDTARLASVILETATLPRVAAIQIDFDAVDSERPFYRRLLMLVRERLPRSMPLSITALASWCVGDGWLAGVPIQEAVPMLFRMGPINEPYKSIGARPSSAVTECRGAVGTSLDEPLMVRRRGRRVYVFNSDPWTAPAVDRARQIAR